ncbi:hypothetical protein CVT24_006778 [Panaeolus cyanescens]|uniref:Cytidyltransferase-like domain-containing protein n=1 Tax=Panaeolus cyanescens TaxID=181874 RepID=A0A409V998_9AGAR|nr:hypothetical protein CVT24_006778 [Panaeolus cyanescens]
MANLLVASLKDLSVPHFLTSAIIQATKASSNKLVILLISPYFSEEASHTRHWHAVQRILTFTYVQATKVAYDNNNVLMHLDVLLKAKNEVLPQHLYSQFNHYYSITGDTLPEHITVHLSQSNHTTIPPQHDSHPVPDTPPQPITDLPSTYPVVALGGTFDHLHSGHKILLSMAAYITNRKLIVGITDDVLLKNKANKHVMENITERSNKVRDFLTLFKPSIHPDIVPITDVYGPTGWDPDIQALVVSKETLSGGDAIAKHRKAHNLPALQPFLIDVISATNASLDGDDADWLKKHKLSSTYIREWIVANANQSKEN